MLNVTQLIEQAERKCKENGSRLTPKRKQVLAGLLESGKALSAYELAHYCEEKFNISMPAMSVYRILDFLQQEQLAHEIKTANKYVACSHIDCDHGHSHNHFLICRQCKTVKELSLPQAAIQNLRDSVNEAGYKLDSPQLEMSGLCDKCIDLEH